MVSRPYLVYKSLLFWDSWRECNATHETYNISVTLSWEYLRETVDYNATHACIVQCKLTGNNTCKAFNLDLQFHNLL